MERGLVIAVGEEDRVIDGQDFDVGIFCPDLVELLGDSLIDGDLTGDPDSIELLSLLSSSFVSRSRN